MIVHGCQKRKLGGELFEALAPACSNPVGSLASLEAVRHAFVPQIKMKFFAMSKACHLIVQSSSDMGCESYFLVATTSCPRPPPNLQP